MKIRWTLIACLALVTSCGKSIPDDIIQPDVMEEVLYDYHISLSMTQNSTLGDKEAQKNYIFNKYQITNALFDSSLVWYSRESKELMEIYENLDKRFSREYSHIERLLESREEANMRTSISGDTVDIWRKGDMQWFSESPLSRQLAFEIKADTTFHERDAFLWNIDYHFFTQGKILMGMNVVYENDSVRGMTKLIESSGNQNIYLHMDSTFKVKELNGFICISDDSIATDTKVLAHHISLTRYHMAAPADTLSSTKKKEEKKTSKSKKKQEEKARTIEKPQKSTPKPQSVSDKRRPRNARIQQADKMEVLE